MDEEALREIPDFTLQKICKQDLYTLSVDDLKTRISALKAEIVRCEGALAQRDDTRAAADKLFKI
jgi:uncharacterized small protein (DUF1192 family)